MADLTQTPANVAVGGAETPTRRVQYGEAIAQGMPVYQSDSDFKFYKSDADTAATAKCGGIALTPGSADEYGIIATPSTDPDRSLVNLGATLTVGETYVVSTTTGGIAPIGDLLSGDFACIIGIAKTAALLDHQVIEPPAAKA